MRRFFTLYFIPLIPLKTLSAYIECQRCHRTYTEEVLNYRLPPSNEELLRQYGQRLANLLAIAAGVDGVPTEHRLAVLGEEIVRLGQPIPDIGDLRRRVTDAAGTDQPVLLAELAERASDRGREATFTAVYSVLTADVSLSQAGQQFLAACRT